MSDQDKRFDTDDEDEPLVPLTGMDADEEDLDELDDEDAMRLDEFDDLEDEDEDEDELDLTDDDDDDDVVPLIPLTGTHADDERLDETRHDDLDDEDDDAREFDSLDAEGLDFHAHELARNRGDFIPDTGMPPGELQMGIIEGDATDEGVVDDQDLHDIAALDGDRDRISYEIGQFTDDKDVQDMLSDRQGLGYARGRLLEDLGEHTGRMPDITANDIDADYSEQGQDEAVGGTNPTPDQDVVDDIGVAAGLTYRDDEELDYSKVNRRDQDRWELDPRSADSELDDEDEMPAHGDLPGAHENDSLGG